MSERTRRQTFWFDAAACSGCKACQIACKDRHDLDCGILWRRVLEVAGGGWQRDGNGWRQDVFAYHLSISCNHCEKPICLEGCPARAITQRPDGVVLIDENHCLGCGYCSWVCPYSAPQYRSDTGTMSKCSFCAEDLDAGIEPACVAACPVRALDAGDPAELAERHGKAAAGAAEIPPLPAAELTLPALALAPHAEAQRSTEPETEFSPRPLRGLREWSLVIFTLLSQTAAGVALTAGALRIWVMLSENDPRLIETRQVELDGVTSKLVVQLLLLGLIASLFHLGRRRNMWRSMLNLRSSWLSREILLALGLLGLAGSQLLPDAPYQTTAAWLTLPAALLFLFGMSRVYMVRTVPVWNTPLTPLYFLSTALLLGGLMINSALFGLTDLSAIGGLTPDLRDRLTTGLSLGLLILLIGTWLCLRLWQSRRLGSPAPTRAAALLSAAAGLALALLLLHATGEFELARHVYVARIALVLAVAAEIKERHAFYGAYQRVGI